ncbi:MAG: polymer-forming cytoskeletal protein, partial [Pseudomonadota bacterium]
PPPVDPPTGTDDEAVLEIRRPAPRSQVEASDTKVASSAAADEPRSTAAPAAIPPNRGKSDSATSHSVIDELLTMRGDIETEGNVQIKGRVFGNVSCVSVIVEDGAIVNGEINAQEVVVRGQTSGAIHGRLVRLEATAVCESDIFHQSFACEQGARIQGQLSYRDASDAAKADAPRKGVTIRQDRSPPSPLPSANGQVKPVPAFPTGADTSD